MMCKFITILALLVMTGMATGCGRGPNAIRLSDVVPLTTDTLSILLLGDPNVSATQIAPADRPLLQTGVYETVAVATDVPGFVELSKGALTASDVTTLQRRVVEELDKRLKKHRFSATETPFPPNVGVDRALVATLSPQIQEITGGGDKARPKKLLLVRLSIVDPKTGRILAQRDYYSGTDVKLPNATPFRRIRSRNSW
jgi:hypothetical protein